MAKVYICCLRLLGTKNRKLYLKIWYLHMCLINHFRLLKRTLDLSISSRMSPFRSFYDNSFDTPTTVYQSVPIFFGRHITSSLKSSNFEQFPTIILVIWYSNKHITSDGNYSISQYPLWILEQLVMYQYQEKLDYFQNQKRFNSMMSLQGSFVGSKLG